MNPNCVTLTALLKKFKARLSLFHEHFCTDLLFEGVSFWVPFKATGRHPTRILQIRLDSLRPPTRREELPLA
jgi:hypothetical protein